MFSQFFIGLAMISVMAAQSAGAFPVGGVSASQTVADKTYSLADRYGNAFVNDVFADNILLTLAYMRGAAKQGQSVDWSKVTNDFSYTMTLKPGETFAFHDSLLPEYKGKVAMTTNAHFNSTEGFKSDGWLVGDGVCHLASFINVVARNAGLQVVSPTRHDFATIPDVPKDYGVAIYDTPDNPGASALQNLYITNTFNVPVSFIFTYKNHNLDIRIEKVS